MTDRPTPTETLEAIRLFLDAQPKLARRLHRPLDTIIAAARAHAEGCWHDRIEALIKAKEAEEEKSTE